MRVEVRPGSYPSSTEPVVRRSADGAVQLVALLDGTASWTFGAEGADRCRRVLDRPEPLPPDLHVDQVLAWLGTSLDSVPEEWRKEGFDFSLALAVLRGRVAEVRVSGAFAVVSVPREGVPNALFRPPMLVDRLVEAGRLSRADAEQHPMRVVHLGPFFDGRPETAVSLRVDLGPSDQLLVGPPSITGLTEADLRCTGLTELRDRAEWKLPCALLAGDR